ncbi:hypothetical protein P3342_005170 [Pyrenophora teres f. teres]|nr:hypothetical protein P3342_005170 [Pyrenophora teres f. teres]
MKRAGSSDVCGQRRPASKRRGSAKPSTCSSVDRAKSGRKDAGTLVHWKGASLRLETLSAVSPTVRNTFSNAYERPSTAPALQRPPRPQLSIESDFPACTSASTPSSASTLSSTLTSASNDSATHSIPYKQPHNLASILSNSPARSIIPRKMNSTRPMFPAEKRVSFRTPLEEEITTTKYTLAHSDIESSCSTLSSMASSASTATNESDASISQPSLTLKPCKIAPEISISPLQLSLIKSSSTLSSAESSPKRAPRTGEKRDSSSSEDDSDSCPETPVAGRRKRTRLALDSRPVTNYRQVILSVVSIISKRCGE